MEIPKQRWRFELGRTPEHCKVFLNDEQWFNVKWLKIDAGNGELTTITLQVYPHEVVVDTNLSLRAALTDGLFET